MGGDGGGGKEGLEGVGRTLKGQRMVSGLSRHELSKKKGRGEEEEGEGEKYPGTQKINDNDNSITNDNDNSITIVRRGRGRRTRVPRRLMTTKINDED